MRCYKGAVAARATATFVFVPTDARETTRSSECGYCGSSAANSDDHIPPETIYASPLPFPRPSVRACPSCHNRQTTLDDEYFGDTILNYHRVSDLPQARAELAAMFRGIAKPKKRKYLSGDGAAPKTESRPDSYIGLNLTALR